MSVKKPRGSRARRPAAEHVLALDLGTTGVRALVLAADGTVRGRAWRALALAIGWQDTRAAHRSADLAERGIVVSTMASETKLEWMLKTLSGLREAQRAAWRALLEHSLRGDAVP